MSNISNKNRDFTHRQHQEKNKTKQNVSWLPTLAWITGHAPCLPAPGGKGRRGRRVGRWAVGLVSAQGLSKRWNPCSAAAPQPAPCSCWQWSAFFLWVRNLLRQLACGILCRHVSYMQIACKVTQNPFSDGPNQAYLSWLCIAPKKRHVLLMFFLAGFLFFSPRLSQAAIRRAFSFSAPFRLIHACTHAYRS